MARHRYALVCSLVALVAGSSACNVTADMGSGIPASEVERARKPVDFLIVLDNSGSMCEEQERLIESFFDRDCPIQDVNAVPEEYMIRLSTTEGSSDTFEELSAKCGLAQLLAAYDNDFRVGVITTDVGPCDNRFGLAQAAVDDSVICRQDPDWERRPQRGCLQAPHGWEKKFLDRGDVGIEQRFREMVDSVGVFGSAFERGLDAVEVFVSDTLEKAPGCEEDAASFLRDDARLAVVFVSDEDDCSHADGAFGLPDENAEESCEHETEFPYFVDGASPSRCYAEADALAPVERYARLLRGLKRDPRDVSVMLLGGATGGRGGATEQGCIAQPADDPITACFESGGNSNATSAGAVCHTDTLAARGISEPCCEADGAPRYAALVNELGGAMAVAESICRDEFDDVMTRFARVLGEPWLVADEDS